MEIKRSGSQPSAKGPDATFTGSVRIDPLFQRSEPARGLGVSVTFEPGARTAWHTVDWLEKVSDREYEVANLSQAAE